MNPERWQRLKAAFVDLVERDSETREAALASLAARDPTLATEVRDLLRSYEEANTRLLAAPVMPLEMAAERSNLVGTQLGPYHLTARVGGGGMGVVYEGTRDVDGKRVAVKVLHGAEDDPDVERQVIAERRILAGLEHDNIARLIDGGVTPEGLPYFTMEFVQGRSIAEFCEERRLDVAARLRLFRGLCAGVQYAHQRLVVHCDIKPGNVLVTDDGVPKLLDFGIARFVHAHEADPDAPTLRASAAMTPAYASPEQVSGAPLTTATDVYALGLLLYELLTGEPAQPLGSFAPAEIVRVVCSSEPRRPSLVAPPQRRRQLAGDLDAIVLKALRKEPEQLYRSAAALADDLERHLNRRPVAARRGTWTYRTSRFLRRHW
ncbi:MAG TPA: serine/threonine-protein kinase, partial [Thermoanaerobaculia bacterium]|nr:serine/threonine-protein kinase [Thermoanaerobaculia bacterium]